MISSLKIQNLVLVEKAEIPFGPGLNILTGETGAGKSAILLAIRLLSGDRAETQMIRDGADLAIVEARISTLLIRREIYRSGKNRCFIDDAQVNLSALRTATSPLLEKVDQSSSLALLQEETQRDLLDAFCRLDTESFSHLFSSLRQKEEELASLQSQSKEKELAWAEKDLQLIEETNWQNGEEQKLTQEHLLLVHAQELLEKLGAISSSLTEGNTPIVSLLKRYSASLEKFPILAPIAASLKTAALEAEDASLSILSHLDKLDASPETLIAVENRLASIETLKRRFGSFEAVQQKKQELLAHIERLFSLDETINALQKQIGLLQIEIQTSARSLSEQRKTGAALLETQTLAELKSLNLPHAAFSIHITPKPLSSYGADEITFLFSANPGLLPAPLQQAVSGGELSRLLLALKTTLANTSSTLVFDEIDSNVGGQTAAILGEKLQRLAISRQVICVTHFLQVARQATHHFRVFKTEEEGKAQTLIEKLSAVGKEHEYNRMLGIA
jgi:DNA repair protein RecN (Recombination protein N)